MKNYSLVLASTSPRRQELLASLGLQFQVAPPQAAEMELPRWVGTRRLGRLVREVALAKALDVAKRLPPQHLVVGSDTTVYCQGEILGKPTDAADAERILQLLSGREHRVYTAVALVVSGNGLAPVTALEVSKVRFRPLSAEEIRRYIDTGEPMDKAGAYGIQGCGGLFIDHIHGCFDNVMGLSLLCLSQAMAQLGLDLLDFRRG